MSRRHLEAGVGFYSMASTYTRPRAHAEMFEEAAREAQVAEDLGFEMFWTVEHHHSYDGYCPSSLPALAYVAARTRKIRFGTGIYVLPHHGAERTSESVAAFRAIAPGRLRLAVGAGNWVDEYAAQNLTLKDRGPLIEEGLAGIAGDDRFGPVELWYGANTPVALKRAGRYGASILMTPATTVETFLRDRAIWQAAYVPRSGQEPRICAFFDVYADPDPRRVEWMRRRQLEMWRNYAVAWSDDPREMSLGLDLERPDDIEKQRAMRDELAARVASGFLAGPPKEIVDRLGPLVEAGIDGFAFRIRFEGAGGPMVERCMEQLAVNVIPQLRMMAQ